MDLHVPTPSSNDNLYDLVESDPPVVPPAPSPPPPPSPDPEALSASPASALPASPPPPPAARAGKGLGRFWKRSPALEGEAQAEGTGPGNPAPPVGPARAEGDAARPRKKKKRRRRRYDAPSWVVSVAVHIAVLALLGVATLSSDDVRRAAANINSALVSGKGAEEEPLHVLATPAEDRGDRAVGSEGSPAAASSEGGGGGGGFVGIGTGPPSATPPVRGVGSAIGEGTSLPGVKVVANVSGLSMIPTASRLGVDLGGGGLISGDITFEAQGVGEALDQLAREILRHLSQHKLTVVWLFDESESMKDDQRAIREKFDVVATALKANVEPGKKQAAALTHAIVGFGEGIHFDGGKPTADIDLIGQAIDRLRVDDSGTENTMQAVQDVIGRYGPLIKKDHRLLIVLVTDESGDDGGKIEEAHHAAVSMKVPIYVIGRQSLFGYSRARIRYVDPVTKDVYWPTIHRGPETADLELLQWDGLYERWDEQPSGFAPYELARLAKDTGGIYFLLPSEESMRVRQREKLYSITTLKEYVPEYDSRLEYTERRTKSEFRRTLYAIIQETRTYPFRRRFPVLPKEPLLAACQEAYQAATERLNVLLKIEERLESLRKLRDREPLKRWQAHYDLMLAQIVAYQVMAYEYRAAVEQLGKTLPNPKVMPSPELRVEWTFDHSQDRVAPKENTQKKYVQAQALLKRVIELHPKTPWADLAQDTLSRGLGCRRNEWHHSPRYEERMKLIPKY